MPSIVPTINPPPLTKPIAENKIINIDPFLAVLLFRVRKELTSTIIPESIPIVPKDNSKEDEMPGTNNRPARVSINEKLELTIIKTADTIASKVPSLIIIIFLKLSWQV